MTSRSDLRLPVLAGRWKYDPRVVFAVGSNAQTFAGRDLATGGEVVVKIFSHAAGGRGRDRFLREARLHEELKHDAILELLDQGQDNGVDYMVTRRLRPGALGDVVRQRSRLSPAATLAIGTRIADALAYLHGRNEVHGDMSPGNIFLDGREADSAYLADFGFSKRVATAPIATTGDGFGTPGFRLPREVGTRRTYEDDVYGLAAVLWFCLTGEPPADSARVRRREISSRSLRAPLNRALAWEAGTIPAAAEFREDLTRCWAKVGGDWRVMSLPPRSSRVRPVVFASLVGLAIAGLSGRALQPGPAHAAETKVDGGGLTLRLAGKWLPRRAPELPALRLKAPVAAAGDSAVVVAGRASSAGQLLISQHARASLPPRARKPVAVVVGDRAALRYSSATAIGVAQEVIVMPLERDALVVRCTGLSSTLSRVCAQAAADLELRRGSPQSLAPSAATARTLREAVDRLHRVRQRQRALLAGSKAQSEVSAASERLAIADRRFAEQLDALPTTAQDAEQIGAAARTARHAAAAYVDLAGIRAAGGWTAAVANVDRREQRLVEAMRQLGSMRVYPVGDSP